MDYSPAGSSVHGIFQARILEWLPFPTPGDLPNPGIEAVPYVSCTDRWILYHCALCHLGSPMEEHEVLNKNHCSTPAQPTFCICHTVVGPRNAKKNIWCVMDFAMHCHTPFQERRCYPSCRKWCQQMVFSCQSLQGLLQWWSCLLQCHAPSWGSPCPKTQESPAICFK